MPLPTIHATAYIVYGSDEKNPFVNVLYYRQNAVFAADAAEAAALCGLIDMSVGVQLINCIAADCNYMRTTLRLNNAGVVYDATDAGSAGAGVIGTESLPDYCAAIIRKRTDTGGRTGRGRWFFGCIAETWNDTGILTAAAQMGYLGLQTALVQNQVTANGTWVPCHHSRKDDTLVPITAATLITTLATLRRRRLRVPV